jgi:hypothetical protein
LEILSAPVQNETLAMNLLTALILLLNVALLRTKLAMITHPLYPELIFVKSKAGIPGI